MYSEFHCTDIYLRKFTTKQRLLNFQFQHIPIISKKCDSFISYFVFCSPPHSLSFSLTHNICPNHRYHLWCAVVCQARAYGLSANASWPTQYIQINHTYFLSNAIDYLVATVCATLVDKHSFINLFQALHGILFKIRGHFFLYSNEREFEYKSQKCITTTIFLVVVHLKRNRILFKYIEVHFNILL